jgi:hypothetical protein
LSAQADGATIPRPQPIAAAADTSARPDAIEHGIPLAAPPCRAMPRALVSKTVLDALIRNKIASTPGCEGVTALPVAYDAARTAGCNWKVPGWVGDSRRIAACRDALETYVRFLGLQFDVPAEGEA